MKKLFISVFSLFFCFATFAQSDEINISASFAQSIELRIVGSANATFTFSSISDYQNGFKEWAIPGNQIRFEIASSTSFQVDFTNTEFTSPAGDILDSRYFYVRLVNRNDLNDYGSTFTWTSGDYQDRHTSAENSNVHVLDKTTKTIIVPGTNGNAGGFEDNQFDIRIGCGENVSKKISGLPSLLDANITPGTYTSVMTLTAVPVIL